MSRPHLGYVAELDGLRGLAALAVLVVHCLIGIVVQPPGAIAHVSRVVTPFLLSGVDMFFVLSGFLIGGILLDNRNAPNFFKVFWVRRIARIFPANYLLLGSYLLALWVYHHTNLPQLNVVLREVSSPPLWTYATFSQNFSMAFDGYEGPRWLVVTWSLAIEEQFYLVFSLVILLLSRRLTIAIAIVAIAAAPILRALAEWHYGWRAAYALFPCRMDALMFGVVVTMIVRHPPTLILAKQMRALVDLMILLLVLLLVGGFARELTYVRPEHPFVLNWWVLKYSILAFLYALLVLRVFIRDGGVFNWALRRPILLKAATISYGLYMYHEAVNLLVHGMIFNQLPKVDSIAEAIAAILVMAAAVGLSVLSYLGVERPIRRLARAMHYGSIPNADQQRARME